MRKYLITILSLISLIILLYALEATISGMVARNLDSENEFTYRVLFCSEDDCLLEMQNLIKNSNKSDCAMYNFKKELLGNNSMRIVSDSNYKGDFEGLRKANSTGLMHNKFCIFDGKKVLTGSFNPSSSRNDKNNMLIIDSKLLAENYELEFIELWNGEFGRGEKTKRPRITLNRTVIESYFCPEDKCADKVIEILEKANSSILFMAYSFTHKGIANSLIFKRMEGLDIRGVIDSSSDKDVYYLFMNQSVEAKIDSKKGIMHNKVFIIDNETVITGSFNPTYNADTRNDENLLIVHNREVAAAYIEEFDRVWS